MFKQMLEDRPGTVIGTLGGIILGILYLIVGFWDMLIFAFIVFIGYYVGKKIDLKELRLQAGNLWQWLSERWRMFR
ncbi:Small integral membrane protein (DUF2273) [Chlamydia abortus]|jgi:uncharacterized membrane protein|uniref:DUF2273 domain-containing protein n=1 Tax=Paenibacillus residui TaxID=629724 RepID=A0ABW3DFN0_9BACL|nr:MULTISPECIES: DUF2273 domain-containing protein [Paenibacillaceae]SHE11147.1 Small integral membrane protein (DUF2273) [Chlamydia abortus]